MNKPDAVRWFMMSYVHYRGQRLMKEEAFAEASTFLRGTTLGTNQPDLVEQVIDGLRDHPMIA